VLSRSKNLTVVICTIVFVLPPKKISQAQQPGLHGPRWGFAVASALTKDVRHPRLTGSWNSAEHLDSVWIVMGRSHTAPIDSIRIWVRSGLRSAPSEKDPMTATSRSDALGRWAAVPGELIRSATGERNVPMPMRVLGVFSPTVIATWARSHIPNRPVATRIAAEIWRHKTSERAELYLESPSAERKYPVVSQPRKPNFVLRGRN
jgi:hypothetical protein